MLQLNCYYLILVFFTLILILKSWKVKISRQWSNSRKTDWSQKELLRSVIHKFLSSIWNKQELPDPWEEFIIVPIYKKCDKTGCNIYRGILLHSTSHRMLSYILLSRSSPYMDEITGARQCSFSVGDKLLVEMSAFVRYWKVREHSTLS